MLVRTGLFIGTVLEADKATFETVFRQKVLPHLQMFPALIDLKFMLAVERDDTAPDIYASLVMIFPSPEAARRALASPPRAAALAQLQEILPLFKGYISHVSYVAE